ncbi:MAG: hypothetical protein ACOC4G_10230 [Bacillota bacterium]
MKIEKIIILENEFEARLMKQILRDEEIPFSIISYVDGPYNGIWKNQIGWGHIEAENQYKNEIIALYYKMKENNNLQ